MYTSALCRLKAATKGKVGKLRKSMEKAAKHAVVGRRAGVAVEEIPASASPNPSPVCFTSHREGCLKLAE